MKHFTKQPNQLTQRFLKVLRCLTCRRVLIEGEEERCWLCSGHHAIYGGDKSKKGSAAA